MSFTCADAARAMWSKSPGQLAYERDVQGTPLYHDGRPRRLWHQLDDATQLSWERNPTERKPQPWRKPAIEVVALADAQHGYGCHHDRGSHHKSG